VHVAAPLAGWLLPCDSFTSYTLSMYFMQMDIVVMICMLQPTITVTNY
jgi:hypothetical protein